jgi:SAM-dependent methyltransferase
MPYSRAVGPDKPWDYSVRARQLVAASSAVLDIGTGGGERFGELMAGHTGRAVATEEWVVNAPVATAHLRPLGIDVVWSADERLPFKDASFDLVLDRHSALTPPDVARVLRPGGSVLTQQLQPNHWGEIRDFFPRAPDQTDLWGNHFELYQEGFAVSGLSLVNVQTYSGRIAYDRLEDFVFMLCITPWTIPDFDPLGGDLDALIELKRALGTDDGIVFTTGSYLIEAWKPAPG